MTQPRRQRADRADIFGGELPVAQPRGIGERLRQDGREPTQPSRIMQILNALKELPGGAARAAFPTTRGRLKEEPFRFITVSDLFERKPLGAEDTTNFLDLISVLFKDFNINFSLGKEIFAAGVADIPSGLALESSLSLGAGVSGLPLAPQLPRDSRMVALTKEADKLWDEARRDGGDIYDVIAGFNARMLESRDERDPYFYGEKLFSEMADPLILLGWQGKAVRWVPGLGKPLAAADVAFTNAMNGIINVLAAGVRKGVAKSTEALTPSATVVMRVGSSAWNKIPLVTQKQAIEMRAARAYDDFRSAVGLQNVGVRIPQMIDAFQSGAKQSLPEQETTAMLARIEAAMPSVKWALWFTELLEVDPHRGARMFQRAAHRTFSDESIARIKIVQQHRSTIGKVLTAPGRLVSIMDEKVYQPFQATVLRPVASLYLRTPQYPWANMVEDMIRSMLGFVSPAWMPARVHAMLRANHPGMVQGLVPEGAGLAMGAKAQDDGLRQLEAGFVGERGWGFRNMWGWYKDATIGLSRKLTIPIQRNYDAQRLVVHARAGWMKLNIDSNPGGRALHKLIDTHYLPGEVENPQALRDAFLLAVVGMDTAAVDAVVEWFSASQVSERLVNQVLRGESIEKQILEPIVAWAQRGGREIELTDVYKAVDERMLDNVKANPANVKAYLDASLEAANRNMGDFKTVEEATGFINSLNMMLQNLRHVPQTINRATAHVVSHHKVARKTRDDLWRDAGERTETTMVQIREIETRAEKLIEDLLAKFPDAEGRESLIAHRKYLSETFRALQDANIESNINKIMDEVYEELDSKRKTSAFWQRFYEKRARIWDHADSKIKDHAKVLAKELNLTGDLDELAELATKGEQWNEMQGALVRIKAGIAKARHDPAVSEQVQGKIHAQGEAIKEILSHQESYLRPSTRQKLRLLRDGGEDVINRKRVKYQGAGYLAGDDVKNAFTNYDDRTAFDALMGHLVPFWQYSSRANLWLGREMLSKPKMFQMFLPGQGKFWEYTENGYIPTVIPGTGLQFGAIKTLMLGRMGNAATRPLYEPRHQGMLGDLDRAFDISAKAGIYPHSLISVLPDLLARLEGGRFALPGEALPPVITAAVDALTVLSPETLGKALRTIFPSDFHDRNIALALAEAGIVPDYDLSTNTFNNPDEELTPAVIRSSMWRTVIEQLGMFRARPEVYRSVLKAAEAIYIEGLVEDGLTQEQAEAAFKEVHDVNFPFERSKSIRDKYPISQLTYQKLRALDGYEAVIRVNDPLTPDAQVGVRKAQREYWAASDKIRKQDNKDQVRDDERSGRSATEGDFLAPRDWVANYRERQKRSGNFIRGLTGPGAIYGFNIEPDGTVSGVPFTPGEQLMYRLATGLPFPLVHEDDRILRSYYSITPEQFPDPYDPEEIDWGAFHLTRGRIMLLVPDESRRKRLQDHIRRDLTPKVRRFTEANQGFMQLYWDADRQGPKFYRDIMGRPDIAADWLRLIGVVAAELRELDIARENQDIRAIARLESSRARTALAKHRRDYKKTISHPDSWEPGSAGEALARNIQAFFVEFMPSKAN